MNTNEKSSHCNMDGIGITPATKGKLPPGQAPDERGWLEHFLDDCGVVELPCTEMSTSLLYSTFELWFQDTYAHKTAGLPRPRMFHQEMKKLGKFPLIRKCDGTYYGNLAMPLQKCPYYKQALWEQEERLEKLENAAA